MMVDWRPTLSDGPEPIYVRLVEALARDVGAGRIAAGLRLPPQRELAHRLGVSVGAITRAYAEAERRGLITAYVGRGSFVAAPPSVPRDPSAPIDLSRNLPPYGPARARIADAVARLPAPDLLDAVGYAHTPGAPGERAAMARWLAFASRFEVEPDRLILTSGAQQGLALAFAALCRPGDTVLCEAATYAGMKNLAEHGGYRLRGLAMDAEGLLPEALDAAAEGARAVFVVPTLQNPTGRIMSAARRAELAGVARRRGLWIVEDDVYSVYAPEAPPPLAAFAPLRTFFVTSLSKAVAPGLRAGVIVPPAGGDHAAAILRAIQALSIAGDAFGRMIAVRWIEAGIAQEIARAAMAEVASRQALALAALGAAVEPPGSPACPHVWLPMGELEAERVAGRALRAGVEVTPPNVCAVAPDLTSGLRICLGAAPDRASVETALAVVADALSVRPEQAAPARV